MIRISKLADYGTIVMHCLSSCPTLRLSANAISERTPVTAATASKVLKLLHEAKLVTSTLGSNGGYQLAKSPDQISLAKIIAAVDGEPAVTECSEGKGFCVHDHCCELRDNWQYINRVIYGVLDNLTLFDMGSSLQDSMAVPLRFYPSTGVNHAER